MLLLKVENWLKEKNPHLCEYLCFEAEYHVSLHHVSQSKGGLNFWHSVTVKEFVLIKKRSVFPSGAEGVLSRPGFLKY